MRATPMLSAVVLACLCACGIDPYEPGTVLGTYHVTAHVQSNSCKEADAPDPWEFDVKLSKDATSLYWIQGSVPVSGALDSHLHATMSNTSKQNVDATSKGPGPCTLERDDALATTLTPDPSGGANQYSAFTGTLSYAYKPTADAVDCSDQLQSNGGPYAALPCSVGYTLSATRTTGPNQYGK
jgi:hypothetical protein